MNKLRFSDTATHDTMVEKVFFRHRTAFVWRWCAVTVPLLYIIYIFCHKSHKCHCPLFSGGSSVTLVFALVSCVTAVPSVFVRSIFSPIRVDPCSSAVDSNFQFQVSSF